VRKRLSGKRREEKTREIPLGIGTPLDNLAGMATSDLHGLVDIKDFEYFMKIQRTNRLGLKDVELGAIE
jgi:hypothetical protein